MSGNSNEIRNFFYDLPRTNQRVVYCPKQYLLLDNFSYQNLLCRFQSKNFIMNIFRRISLSVSYYIYNFLYRIKYQKYWVITTSIIIITFFKKKNTAAVVAICNVVDDNDDVGVKYELQNYEIVTLTSNHKYIQKDFIIYFDWDDWRERL